VRVIWGLAYHYDFKEEFFGVSMRNDACFIEATI